MEQKLSNRAAVAAARAIEQAKFDLIPKLATALRTIDSDLEAITAATQRLAADERAYTEVRESALKAGWTAAHLATLGYRPTKYLPHKQRRRRTAPTTVEPATPQDAALAQNSNEAPTVAVPTASTAVDPAALDPAVLDPAPTAGAPRPAPDRRHRAPDKVVYERPPPDQGLFGLVPRTDTSYGLPAT